MKTQRRIILKKFLASLVGVTGLGMVAKATTSDEEQQEVTNVVYDEEVPLFSSVVKHGKLIYLAGIGAHVEPFEIKAHTEIVLKEMENQLKKAGSSMEKVLKVTVFLNDINDYKGMNEVFRGRFGKKPPVRTTVAVAKGGVPGNSLVEMDCIARR